MNTTTTQDSSATTEQARPTAAMVQAAENGATAPGGAINVFADDSSFNTAIRMGKALAASTMVPEIYRNNLPNVLIAIELASRIGASVFAVMQNVDIIHGRPSWRATFLIATVNASSRFTPLRFRWSGEEGKPSWGCRAYAKDRENGEECVGALITVALANAEGWSTKSGSKWKTMPEQMLMYRAASFWTRVYAPELSLGMRTTEESEDIVVRELPPLPLAPQVNPVALESAILARDAAVVPPSSPAAEEPRSKGRKATPPPTPEPSRSYDPTTGEVAPEDEPREPGSDDT